MSFQVSMEQSKFISVVTFDCLLIPSRSCVYFLAASQTGERSKLKLLASSGLMGRFHLRTLVNTTLALAWQISVKNYRNGLELPNIMLYLS